MYGFHLFPKTLKVDIRSFELDLPVLLGRKQRRTDYASTARLSSRGLVTVLEGCLAATRHIESTLKHHTDKVERSMREALKVPISFYFSARPKGVLKAVIYFWKTAPGFSGSLERRTGVTKARREGSRICWRP